MTQEWTFRLSENVKNRRSKSGLFRTISLFFFEQSIRPKKLQSRVLDKLCFYCEILLQTSHNRMGGAVSIAKELLTYLKEEGPYVLASPEDAAYFRKKVIVETPPPIVKMEIPVFKPVAIEKPVVNEEDAVVTSFQGTSVRNVLSVVAPELALLNEIPSDTMARKIAERWKTKNQTAPISLLLFQEPAEQRALLEQIAKALDICFGSAKIVYAEGIEKEKQWESFLSVADLKMVIVCDYTLWQLSSLMQFYKETPAQGTRMLHNTPLFLLPDLSLYLKDPLLKRSLWKALCQKCS